MGGSVKILVSITQEGENMRVIFGSGVRIETLSHALRIAGLQLDNFICNQQLRKKAEQRIHLPDNVTNRLFGNNGEK